MATRMVQPVPPSDDPRLMLRIVLYGDCVGVRSSRELARVCVDVVASRWLAGQRAPDFRSIGRFRKRRLAALGNAFLQPLELCRAAGMVSLGRLALGGAKVHANASRRKAMSYARLTERQKVLAVEVSGRPADAQAVDTAEDTRFEKDKRGDELPPEGGRGQSSSTRAMGTAQTRSGFGATSFDASCSRMPTGASSGSSPTTCLWIPRLSSGAPGERSNAVPPTSRVGSSLPKVAPGWATSAHSREKWEGRVGETQDQRQSFGPQGTL